VIYLLFAIQHGISTNLPCSARAEDLKEELNYLFASNLPIH